MNKMMKLVLIAVFGMAVVCAGSVKKAEAVPFGDGGAALQGVLDGITITPSGSSSVNVITDELGYDSVWMVGGSGGIVSTLVIELAAFADENTFGIYDAYDSTNTLELFAGSSNVGDQTFLSIVADGTVTAIFFDNGTFVGTNSAVFAGNAFGFYLDSSANLGGGNWFSETSLNSDGVDHMAAYQGVGDTIQVPGLFSGPWGSGEYILAWEDLDFAATDADYTDFVVMVESVTPVPEPGTIALLGIGLAGLVGAGVRRRMKKTS